MAALIIDEELITAYRKSEAEAGSLTFLRRQPLPGETAEEFIERVLASVRKALTSGAFPDGISISKDRAEFKISAFPSSPWAAFGNLTLWIYLTAFCLFVWSAVGRAGRFGYPFCIALLVLVQAVFVQAMLYMWGHYRVVMNADKSVVFVGIGSLGLRRDFNWKH
jgi:hypothetical protein